MTKTFDRECHEDELEAQRRFEAGLPMPVAPTPSDDTDHKSTVHKLKTLAPYWDAIERGDKNFEVRRDDRGFQRGDILILQRMREDRPDLYDMDSFSPLANRKEIRKRISYILTGGHLGIEPGFVVMGLRDV